MIHFEHSSLIAAPVERVFAFHEQPDALERLTPPWQRIEVVRKSGGILPGAQVELRVFAGPVPVRWLAEHTAYEKDRLFVDVQREGPLRCWTHRHEFAREGTATRLTDRIDCGLPGGSVADRLAGWIVQAHLRRLFIYRHAVTRRACEELSR